MLAAKYITESALGHGQTKEVVILQGGLINPQCTFTARVTVTGLFGTVSVCLIQLSRLQ